MSFSISELNNSKLPTKCDVINFFLYLRHNTRPTRKLFAFKQEALRSICSLWQRAGIAIISVTAIRKRLDKLVNDYYKVIKYPSKYNVNEWNKLFLISRCKCCIQRDIPCSCTASNKIPDAAKDFFIDQCGPRLMTLDEVDTMSITSGGIRRTPENITAVAESVREAPSTSIHRRSQQLNIPETSLRRILHKDLEGRGRPKRVKNSDDESSDDKMDDAEEKRPIGRPATDAVRLNIVATGRDQGRPKQKNKVAAGNEKHRGRPSTGKTAKSAYVPTGKPRGRPRPKKMEEVEDDEVNDEENKSDKEDENNGEDEQVEEVTESEDDI